MSDLVVFLRARLDEDEAAAKGWVFRGTAVMLTEDEPAQADAEYLATFSGARVLAEAKAKRAILAEHAAYPWPEVEHIVTCHACGVRAAYPCTTLRVLGAVYGDHPDYEPAWAPAR